MALYVKIKGDKNAIMKKIVSSRAFVEKGWIAAEKMARSKYERSKTMFFRDFLDHEVTKEIKAGSGASNTSGLLGGRANLFSFFGFDEGSDPIGDLNLYLGSVFNFSRGSYRDRQWSFRISFPDEDKAAEYVVGKHGLGEYTTESWVEGIEKGHSGLAYYIRYSGKGRSGGGIQSKHMVRAMEFQTTAYFSKIVSNFKRNINR